MYGNWRKQWWSWRKITKMIQSFLWSLVAGSLMAFSSPESAEDMDRSGVALSAFSVKRRKIGRSAKRSRSRYAWRRLHRFLSAGFWCFVKILDPLSWWFLFKQQWPACFFFMGLGLARTPLKALPASTSRLPNVPKALALQHGLQLLQRTNPGHKDSWSKLPDGIWWSFTISW